MSKLKEGYIRYSNEEQRKAAIMQAESLGFKKWDQNDLRRDYTDAAIYLYAQKKDWRDHSLAFVRSQNCDEIPLDAKEYDKAMTNTEKQALLFKLEQDKQVEQRLIEYYMKVEVDAVSKIFVHYVTRGMHPEKAAINAKESIGVLFESDIKIIMERIDSIEQHIEELEG